MTCEQGLLRLLWGGPRSWSATALPTSFVLVLVSIHTCLALTDVRTALFIILQLSKNAANFQL